jgi:hypothetical protein
MKRTLLLLAGIFVSITINAQLVNGDIESWTETDPTDWLMDIGFGPMPGTNNWVETLWPAEGDPLTTNKLSGAAAAGGVGHSAILETMDMTSATIIAAGILQADGLLTGRFPISGNGNPTDFSFDYHVAPMAGDTGIVWLTLYDADTLVVGESGLIWTSAEATSGWTSVVLPITYSGSNDVALVDIYCSSSFSLDESYVTGSMLSVDNFLISGFAGVTKIDFEAKAYPNPTNDVLNIELTENVNSVSIIGMDGKVISNNVINSQVGNIDVSRLNSGMYFYEAISENGEVIRNSFVKE